MLFRFDIVKRLRTLSADTVASPMLYKSLCFVRRPAPVFPRLINHGGREELGYIVAAR